MNKLKKHINTIPIILIIISLLIILSVVLYIYSNKWSENKPISGIIIENNNYVSKNEILSKINNYIKSKTKKEINLDTVSTLVKQIKYINTVKSFYGLNGELKIYIEERIPIAYVINTNNQLLAIDKDGIIFENPNILKYSNLPILYVNDNNLEKINFLKILNFLSFNNDNSNDVFKLFNEFYVMDDCRILKAKERLYNLDVILSTENDLISQFNNYLSFIKLINNDNKNNINYLDLRWKSQVIVSYKNLI